MSDKATYWRKRCLNPGRDKRNSLQNVQNGPWGYLASYSVSAGVLGGYSSLGGETPAIGEFRVESNLFFANTS